MATPAYVYARAVFELAEKKGLSSQVLQEIQSFADVMATNNPIRLLFTSGVVTPGARRGIVKDICSALSLSELSTRLLTMLSDRSRLAALPSLIKYFEGFQDEVAGVRSGVLKSAVELSGEEVATLSAALAKKLGTKVKLTTKTDPALLGGFVAHVGGKTYDASLKSQLERFKSELV